jgi:HlyD family secretion protein
MPLSSHTAETIVNTSIAYKYKISTQSKVIYLTVLVVVAGALAALPFLKVQISVRSASGYLQPAVEKQQLYAPITGRITQLMVLDNQKIKQGEPNVCLAL